MSSVLFVYYSLCCEEHRWWWRSFLSSVGLGIYTFLYAVKHHFSKLEFTRSSDMTFYYLCVVLISFIISTVAGSLGFLCSWLLVKKLHTAVGKVRNTTTDP